MRSPLRRDEIINELQAKLAEGIDKLPEQLRYVLVLSQVGGRKKKTVTVEPPHTSTAAARLQALTAVIDTLPPADRYQLLSQVNQLSQTEDRLRLTVRLLPHLHSDIDNALIHGVIDDANNLENPAIQADVLIHLAQVLPQLSLGEGQMSAALSTAIATTRRMRNPESRIRSLIALVPHLPSRGQNNLFRYILGELDAIENDTLQANALNAMNESIPQDLRLHAYSIAKGIVKPTERARALTALSRSTLNDRQEINLITLQTIAQIEADDERGDALILFAPHLEAVSIEDGFPEVMQKALEIAISFTKRTTRARALVALAPYLTDDLQGEALAAVNNLSSERERALLLAELAPTLKPNMVVASLAVAHTMREQDARVHALTVLAHYAPAQARSQTLLDALAAASNLPHHYERVTALIQLIDVLPATLREQAFTNALDTTAEITNENAQARALSLIGAHLPERLLLQALDIADNISDQEQRLYALAGLVDRLPETRREKQLLHMLDAAKQMPFDYKRARTLVSIAPHFTPQTKDFIRQEALKIAFGIEDPFDQTTAIIAILQNIPREDRQPIIDRAWQQLAHIEDGYDRSNALAAIAPYVSDERKQDLARYAQEVIASIEDEYDCASAITILAPLLPYGASTPIDSLPSTVSLLRSAVDAIFTVEPTEQRLNLMTRCAYVWAKLPTEQAYALWQHTALSLGHLPLSDTLYVLSTLRPIFLALGGKTSLQNIAHILGVR
jgi:hypothetical protein